MNSHLNTTIFNKMFQYFPFQLEKIIHTWSESTNLILPVASHMIGHVKKFAPSNRSINNFHGKLCIINWLSWSLSMGYSIVIQFDTFASRRFEKPELKN